MQPSPARTFAYFNGHILTRTKNLTAAEADDANLAKATIQSTILGGLSVGRGASCEAGRGPYQVQYVYPTLFSNWNQILSTKAMMKSTVKTVIIPMLKTVRI